MTNRRDTAAEGSNDNKQDGAMPDWEREMVDTTFGDRGPAFESDVDVMTARRQAKRVLAKAGFETALAQASSWISDRDKHLRRLRRRYADVDGTLPDLISALILYVQKVHPSFAERETRSTIYGLTFAIQASYSDSETTGIDGTVDPSTLLYDVLNAAEEFVDLDVRAPRAGIDHVFELPSHDRTAVWDAVRAVTKPASTSQVAMNGAEWHSAEEELVPLTPISTEPLPVLLQQLHAMTGLSEVKATVESELATLKVEERRRDLGLRKSDRSRHMIFRGNPGTGKTALARMFAALYTATGIMDSATMVETDRSGLVAQWLGKTALRTNKAVDEALGGVLFIDEAYSLASGGSDGADRFAHEALDTLVKRMEDDRDDLIVILAGYPDEMDQLLDMNPGLRSRIGLAIDFPDYADGELLAIVSSMATAADYTITDEGLAHLNDRLATIPRGKTFGNARLMRTLLEASIAAQAVRLQPDIETATEHDLRELTTHDITIACERVVPNAEVLSIGFGTQRQQAPLRLGSGDYSRRAGDPSSSPRMVDHG